MAFKSNLQSQTFKARLSKPDFQSNVQSILQSNVQSNFQSNVQGEAVTFAKQTREDCETIVLTFA